MISIALPHFLFQVQQLSQTLLESSYLTARKSLELEHPLHLPTAKRGQSHDSVDQLGPKPQLISMLPDTTVHPSIRGHGGRGGGEQNRLSDQRQH